MFKFIRQFLSGATIAAAAFLPQAHAGGFNVTIDFEGDPPLGLYFDGDSFTQSGFRFTVISSIGTVDTVVGYGNPNNFPKAPNGSQGQFYGGFDDSLLLMTRDDSLLFSVTGLDFGFIADRKYAEHDDPGGLFIVGFDSGFNPVDYVVYSWGGADAAGEFSFQSLGAGDLFGLATQPLAAVLFQPCAFVGNNCNNPADNKGQFAVDNIQIHIPEPTSVALMGLALLGLALTRRRTIG